MSAGISVVIPTRGRPGRLARTLGGVFQSIGSTGRSGTFEVIVVDNAPSTDRTREVVESEEIGGRPRYVREDLPGPANARNSGAAAASGRYLAFLDDDLDVSADWAPALLSLTSEPDRPDAAMGRILPRWEGSCPSWVAARDWGPLGILDFGPHEFRLDPDNPKCMMSGNLVVRRDLFLASGGFDAALLRSEDHDLTVRLLAMGCDCRYRPDLSVTSTIESERMTLDYFRRWHRLHGYFAYLLDQRHPYQGPRLFGIPRFMVRELIEDVLPFRSRSGSEVVRIANALRKEYLRGYLDARRGRPAPNARLI